MSFRPRTVIRACPGCGQSRQFDRFRSMFSCDVRLECPCGVAGQWRNWSPNERRDPWHDAAAGWEAAFGLAEMRSPPPPPVDVRVTPNIMLRVPRR